jgi:hypothetical protein
MKRLHVIILLLIVAVTALTPAMAQRRATPVNNAATRTQSQNDARGDSARALERKRARSIQYTDDKGRIVMVDTVTGNEWIDSTLLPKQPPMKYQLLHAINVGVNFFDPLMRLCGQRYGGMDAYVNVSLHNRYLPTFEFGMGQADNTPSDNNYTYTTPFSPYFKLGLDYNFMYNKNPDYQFFAGLRYGFSPFKYTISDVTLTNGGYWGEENFSFDQVSATAGWYEFVLGLRVKLFKQISAGWSLKYHSILHQSHPGVGDAWYIPGYGSSTSSLAFTFAITYTLPFKVKKVVTDESPVAQ